MGWWFVLAAIALFIAALFYGVIEGLRPTRVGKWVSAWWIAASVIGLGVLLAASWFVAATANLPRQDVHVMLGAVGVSALLGILLSRIQHLRRLGFVLLALAGTIPCVLLVVLLAYSGYRNV